MNINGQEIKAEELFTDTLEKVIIECRICGRSVPVKQFILFGCKKPIHQTVCNGCREKRDQDREAAYSNAASKRQRETWETICPVIYRDSTIEKLPCPYETQEKVIDWNIGPRGMVLHGPPRTGKTRLIYILLDQLFNKMGKDVFAMTATAFSHQISALFGSDSTKGQEFVQRCADAGILLIDELGKEKMTDRIESEFFYVIDRRCSMALPTFITTNLTGAEFKAKWSPDRAGAILYRFKEFFQWIPVTMRTTEQPATNP